MDKTSIKDERKYILLDVTHTGIIIFEKITKFSRKKLENNSMKATKVQKVPLLISN
jgi:hypothetical protein